MCTIINKKHILANQYEDLQTFKGNMEKGPQHAKYQRLINLGMEWIKIDKMLINSSRYYYFQQMSFFPVLVIRLLIKSPNARNST